MEHVRVVGIIKPPVLTVLLIEVPFLDCIQRPPAHSVKDVHPEEWPQVVISSPKVSKKFSVWMKSDAFVSCIIGE